MRRLPPAAAVCAGLLGSCGVDEGGGPLDWPTAARAALLAVRPEGSETVTRSWLAGSELQGAEVSLPRGGEAWLLGFAPRLDALQVAPGPLRDPGMGSENCGNLSPRSLPLGIHRARGGPSGWQAVEAFESGVFDDVRLAPLELNRCLEGGGCIEVSRVFCQTACASAPPVAPPREPLPVRPPRVCPSCAEGRPAPGPCPVGQRFDVSTGACLRVGTPCPVGPFPEPSSMDPPTVHVDAAATPGGDGSRSRPFRTLEEGLDAPGRLLVASGQYGVEGLDLVDAWIEGVCPEATQLIGRLRASGNSTLGNLRLEGALEVGEAALLQASSVELSLAVGSSEPALAVEGRFEAREVSIDGGVQVSASGQIQVAAASLRGSPALSVLGSAEVTEALLEPTQPSTWVVRTNAGGTLSLARSVVSATGGNAARVSGGRLDLADVSIEGAVGNLGLFAQRGAELELSRVRISGFASFPVLVEDDARARGGDLDIEQGSGALAGLQIRNGGRAELARIRVIGSAVGVGVFVQNAGAPPTLSDISVTGTQRGMRIEGSDARVSRLAVTGAAQDGLSVTGSGRVDVEDVILNDVGAIGLLVGSLLDRGVGGTMRRARVSRAGQDGILFEQLGFTLIDVEVTGSRVGLHIKPGLDLAFSSSTAVDRVRLVDTEFALLMDRVVRSTASRLRMGQVEVVRSSLGVQLPSCWPDQGAFFAGFRFAEVLEPIRFTDPIDGGN
ncbi:MAG: hypothetical protein AAFZ18_01715 [Myxococcota bacterium]